MIAHLMCRCCSSAGSCLLCTAGVLFLLQQLLGEQVAPPPQGKGVCQPTRGLPPFPHDHRCAPQAATAAWRKQVALRWQEQYGGQPEALRLGQVPMLLGVLLDAASIAQAHQLFSTGPLPAAPPPAAAGHLPTTAAAPAQLLPWCAAGSQENRALAGHGQALQQPCTLPPRRDGAVVVGSTAQVAELVGSATPGLSQPHPQVQWASTAALQPQSPQRQQGPYTYGSASQYAAQPPNLGMAAVYYASGLDATAMPHVAWEVPGQQDQRHSKQRYTRGAVGPDEWAPAEAGREWDVRGFAAGKSGRQAGPPPRVKGGRAVEPARAQPRGRQAELERSGMPANVQEMQSRPGARAQHLPHPRSASPLGGRLGGQSPRGFEAPGPCGPPGFGPCAGATPGVATPGSPLGGTPGGPLSPRCGGRGMGVELRPLPPVVPVLLRHFTRSPGRPAEEWVLTGREISIMGLPPDVSHRELRELLEGASGRGECGEGTRRGGWNPTR